jgi:hypothetical protein
MILAEQLIQKYLLAEIVQATRMLVEFVGTAHRDLIIAHPL